MSRKPDNKQQPLLCPEWEELFNVPEPEKLTGHVKPWPGSFRGWGPITRYLPGERLPGKDFGKPTYYYETEE